MNGRTNQQGQTGPKQPTHDVKVARRSGEKTTYERIGAAWQREDGSLYVKLIGTQIVSEGFTLYLADEVAR